MPGPHLIPRRDTELIPWLIQFGPKLAQYAPALGLSEAEVEQTRREIDYLVYLLNVHVPALRRTFNAAVEFKNFIKDGEATGTVPALPGASAMPPAPEPVPPGVLTRLRKLVQNLKTRPGYTEVIGRDLDIVRQSGSRPPDAPTLALASAVAGAVTIGWNKAGWSGVRFQSRAKGGEWTDIGVDLHSPFVDARPLATPFQPEGREYRASYLDGDTPQAVFSQVLEVIVGP